MDPYVQRFDLCDAPGVWMGKFAGECCRPTPAASIYGPCGSATGGHPTQASSGASPKTHTVDRKNGRVLKGVDGCLNGARAVELPKPRAC